eukprot:4572652-Pyramimonas_sp.AAC.1
MLKRFGAVQVVSFSQFVRDAFVAISRIEAENAPMNAAFHALQFAGVNVSLTFKHVFGITGMDPDCV